MREILFKSKSENIDGTFDWVEGHLSKCNGEWVICDDEGAGCFVEEETICQYTGLTDKNGAKIWENDIVEAYSEGTKAIGKIKQRIDGTWIMYPAWQKQEFWYLLPNEQGKTTVKVIGNIFDNAELLEGCE